MKVAVYLHTILGRQTPQGIVREVEAELPPGATLLDLLQALQIELAADQIMLVVNGMMVDERHPLHDGDRVNLMPAISGGAYFPSQAPNQTASDWAAGFPYTE